MREQYFRGERVSGWARRIIPPVQCFEGGKMHRGFRLSWVRDQSQYCTDGVRGGCNWNRVRIQVGALSEAAKGLSTQVKAISAVFANSAELTSIAILSRLSALASDRSGNVAIITALAMPVLVGAMGLGGEVGYWYYRQQEMQSAADSAAVAAAAAGGSS